MTKENKQLEFDIKNIFDIEIEKEDREVGIFGNLFTIGFETENKENIFLNLNDDEFMLLIEKIKPYVLDEIAKEKIETEMYKQHLEEEKEKKEYEMKKGKIVNLLRLLRLRK